MVTPDETAQLERDLSALVARYYRAEIGRLMQQAEHWAKNGQPLAVHHRLCKAEAYFQIVALFERHAARGENPFAEMREELARPPIYPPGAYPPSVELHRYRDPSFVIGLLGGEL